MNEQLFNPKWKFLFSSSRASLLSYAALCHNVNGVILIEFAFRKSRNIIIFLLMYISFSHSACCVYAELCVCSGSSLTMSNLGISLALIAVDILEKSFAESFEKRCWVAKLALLDVH